MKKNVGTNLKNVAGDFKNVGTNFENVAGDFENVGTNFRNKAERFCSASEHCPSEVAAKLKQWGASDEEQDLIIAHLQKERYIDTERYCRFFARDKYRFTHWGRVKIAQALKMKGLPSEDIRRGLEEIDEREYDDILRDLINKKRKSVSGRNDYERNAKLIRFAIGRGFEMDEIRRHLKDSGDEYPD